ncbi:hypothetical protein [Streptomyces aculeolatus]|uniref:hypothetical protein n=1 Tax=Streptomyces aculeolatus TaxID=270689 RepID=UPI001CECBD80|nr:hypothetical protein [Streptomyces aculeolatus]
MDEHDWLAERFETDRPGLRPLAYRLLGPADDEAAGGDGWTRLSRADRGARATGATGADGARGSADRAAGDATGAGREGAEDLDGCLRTTVAQVTLHMLRSGTVVESPGTGEPPALPGSVRVAMLVVLDTLTPPERLAYALQDMFAGSFEEVAALAARTTRQLAGSARGPGPAGEAGYDRGLSGAAPAVNFAARTGADIAGAFLAASRGGDFEAMLTALDPNHPNHPERGSAPQPPRTKPTTGDTPRNDGTPHPPSSAGQPGTHAERRGGDAVIGTTEVRGPETVTRVCTVRTWAPIPALIDGAAGLVWVRNGRPQLAFRFTVQEGEITATELETDIADLSIVY